MIINLKHIRPFRKHKSLEVTLSKLGDKIKFADLLEKADILDAIWCLRETETDDAQYELAIKIMMYVRHYSDSKAAINTAIDYYYDIANIKELHQASDDAYKAWKVNKTPINWASFCLTKIDDCDPTDLLYDVTEAAINNNQNMEERIKTMLLEVFA